MKIDKTIVSFLEPGQIYELPTSTNWLELWRYITLELKQSSIWFIPFFKGDIVAKLLLRIWPKHVLEELVNGDYLFYAFDYDDIKSIMATIYLDFEKHKKDWLVIKADSAYIEKYRGQIQELANNISFKVILIY